MNFIFQGLGWVGAIGLLIGYFLNSTGRLSSDSRLYQCINLICATMLAANAFYIDAIPFIIINCFWAGVALLSLLKKQNKQTQDA